MKPGGLLIYYQVQVHLLPSLLLLVVLGECCLCCCRGVVITWHCQDVEQVVPHQELHLLALLGTLPLLVGNLGLVSGGGWMKVLE